MANYKNADVNQYKMRILNLIDLYDENHPTAQFWNLLNKLDYSKFDASYVNDKGSGGCRAYDPRRVIAVIIWHLLYGNISMRQLERDLQCRADLLYLSGGQVYDHSTISRFRKRHKLALEDLFKQTVFTGVVSGLIDFETICIDGSKLKGYANREGFFTKEELKKLLIDTKDSCDKRLEELASGIGDSELIKKAVKKLKSKEARIEAGLSFLKEHKDRDKVHIIDPDCRWQKERNGSFTAGYNGQMAVDSKNQMIVAKDVVSENADNGQCIPMVSKVNQIKEECLEKLDNLDGDVCGSVVADLEKKSKIILDAGYYSEANLKALKDEDIYIPDNNLSHYFKQQRKPESLDGTKSQPDQDYKPVIFEYDKTSDSFVCPKGKRLTYYRDIRLKGTLYRTYRVSGCRRCPLKKHCTTHNTRKEICVRPEMLGDLKEKIYQKRQQSSALHQVAGEYTRKMRNKLLTPAGKEIYNMRFWVSEGVFGLITYIRNGAILFRRGLPVVNQDWTERSIAHNMGKLLNFRLAV